MSIEEPESLVGVVTPREVLAEGKELLPQDREATPFEDARGRVQIALAMTQERLRELRKLRETTNAEIKLLVDEEDLLVRMSRVRKAPRS